MIRAVNHGLLQVNLGQRMTWQILLIYCVTEEFFGNLSIRIYRGMLCNLSYIYIKGVNPLILVEMRRVELLSEITAV